MPKVQPKTFKDLTPEQRERFEARIKRHGIARDRVPKHVVAEGQFVVHADPALTSCETHTVIVKNLAEFKDIGGVPDARYTEQGFSDVFIQYPPPIPAERLRALKATRYDRAALLHAMEPDEQSQIREAMTAYSLGDSAKVSPEWVEIANATNFPMEVSVVAAENLDIRGEYLIKGPGPVDLNFGTVTIYAGGYIKALAPVTFNAQVITRL